MLASTSKRQMAVKQKDEQGRVLGLEFSLLQVRLGTGFGEGHWRQGKGISQAVEVGTAMEGGMRLYLEAIRLQSLAGIQGTYRALGEAELVRI